jgi:hypothetical protein
VVPPKDGFAQVGEVLVGLTPRSVIWLCIGQIDLNGKEIPLYKCGQMDECGLCFAQNNMRTLCNMFMRSWAILGFDGLLGPIIYCKHNIGDGGCNYMFNKKIISVWCVLGGWF